MTLFLLLACGTTGAGPGDLDPDAPTWHADIAPIFVERCGSCHTAGGVGPFTLDTFDAAAPLAALSLDAVETGRMPPWDAETTDTCEPRFGWKDDPRLSDDEVELIRAWVDAGAPEGDPSEAVELPVIETMSLADADARLTLGQGWTAEGDRDQFRCFSLDPDLIDDVWVTGIQLEPGSRAVVHHALIWTDPYALSAELDPGGASYDCPGGGNVDGSALLHTWTPGQVPFHLHPDTGVHLPAGSRVIVQVHYHPYGAQAIHDLSTLELTWSDERPRYEAINTLIGNHSEQREDGSGLQPGPNDPARGPVFKIPADTADHTEIMVEPMGGGDWTVKLLAVGNHMHQVGVDQRMVVEHAEPEAGEPAEECLLQTPRWDFEWQRQYLYDAELEALPEVRGGDIIRIECAYDNTVDNPAVAKMLADEGLTETFDVYLGESSTDEMCIGMFQYLSWDG